MFHFKHKATEETSGIVLSKEVKTVLNTLKRRQALVYETLVIFDVKNKNAKLKITYFQHHLPSIYLRD